MIKAIIFDCFGVLTIGDHWREFWAGLPKDQADQARELHRRYDRAEITHAEFIKAISELTGIAAAQVDARLESENIKNQPVLDYIAQLKPKYKIGIISNIASDWISTEFLTKDEQKLFDDMVLSYQVGISKPDPRIFKMALEKLGIQPGEAVMIDDIDIYCASAADIGMKTVVYDNFAQMKDELEKILADSNN